MKSKLIKFVFAPLAVVIGVIGIASALWLGSREPGESASMRAIDVYFRLRGKGAMTDAALMRKEYQGRVYPSVPTAPPGVRDKFEVMETRVQGRTVISLTPKQDRSGLHIIYTHGGTYINELIDAHWGIIEQLIEQTGAAVTIPIYPLAPEHTYKQTYSLLDEVYRDVTSRTEANKIILCGDSAGGGLALGQAMYFRDQGLALPGRIILFSPWLDITVSNPEIPSLEPFDPMLTTPGPVEAGKWWAGGDDPRSPLLSPLFGNLTGLPPIDVFIGTHDITLPDTRILNDKVTAAGGEIHLYEYPGALHVFVAATFTPEAKDAYRRIAEIASALSGAR